MLTYNVIECFQIIIIPSKINYKFQKIERFWQINILFFRQKILFLMIKREK